MKNPKIGRMSSVLYAWGPATVWMAVIFYFSTRQRVTVSESQVLNFLFFKSLHVIEYAALFTLYLRAVRMTVKMRAGTAAALAFLLTVTFAFTDELHQLFVPTREGSLRDGIIDALGALCAWTVVTYIIPGLPLTLRRTLRDTAGPFLQAEKRPRIR